MPDRAAHRSARAGLMRAVALLAGVLSSGCSGLTTLGATPGPHPTTRPVPVQGTALFDWKGVVHCHSYLSHDCKGQLPAIEAACKEAAIDFLVMTDHQTDASVRDGARGLRGGTLFVVGAEIRTPQGTVIAFPLTKPLRHWQHATLLAREAEAQGAVALVCHAELWKDVMPPGFSGFEIVNLHAGVMARNKAATLATGLFLPLSALMRHLCVRDDGVFARWDRWLAQQHPFTPVGGNDAHESVRIFGPLGGTIGTYREVFLTLSTHVLAERLDEASLVEAVRLGRTYVSFDIFGEGSGFDFRAEDAAGCQLPGSTVARSPALRLRAHTPQSAHLELRRDGAQALATDGQDLELADPPPGIYRVEVTTAGGQPWLFSSSIRVLAGATPEPTSPPAGALQKDQP